MTERNFFRILIAVIAVCAVLTAVHLIYDFYASVLMRLFLYESSDAEMLT